MALSAALAAIFSSGELRSLIRALAGQDFASRIGPIHRQYPQLDFGDVSRLASATYQSERAGPAVQLASVPGEQLRLKDFPVVPGAVSAESPGSRFAINVETSIQFPGKSKRPGPSGTVFASTLGEAEALIEDMRRSLAQRIALQSPRVAARLGITEDELPETFELRVASVYREY